MDNAKYFYTAATQFENLGDIVLAEQIISHMRQRGSVYIDDRDCPEEYLTILGLSESESTVKSSGGFKRKLIASAVYSLISRQQTVRFSLKPGHMKVRGTGLKTHAYTFYLKLLKILGVEIFRYGASLEFENIKAETVEVNRSAAYHDYTLRDQYSLKRAKAVNIANARYFPDLALGLPFSNGKDKLYIGSSFRSDLEENTTVNIETCTNILQAALRKHPNSQPLSSSQVYRDDGFNAEIADALKAKKIFFDGSQTSKHDLFDCYSKTHWMISNRLHALVFAASKGAIPIPFVSGTKNAKIVDLFASVGIEDLIFDYDKGESFKQHIDYIAANEAEIRTRIHNAFKTFHEYSMFTVKK